MYNGHAIPLNAQHVVDGTGGKPLSPLVNKWVARVIGRCECRRITRWTVRRPGKQAKFNARGKKVETIRSIWWMIGQRRLVCGARAIGSSNQQFPLIILCALYTCDLPITMRNESAKAIW